MIDGECVPLDRSGLYSAPGAGSLVGRNYALLVHSAESYAKREDESRRIASLVEGTGQLLALRRLSGTLSDSDKGSPHAAPVILEHIVSDQREAKSNSESLLAVLQVSQLPALVVGSANGEWMHADPAKLTAPEMLRRLDRVATGEKVVEAFE